MRAVVQRVASAAVSTAHADQLVECGRIGAGLLVFVGVELEDDQSDVAYLVGKVQGLRVFADPSDPDGRMTRSVGEVGGHLLVVSQFTLAGDCRKGRRPSFDTAAPSHVARPLYEAVVQGLRDAGLTVATGEFGATMQVALVNDGPVTLLLDSRRAF